jgi:hypothetical protein
MVDDDHTSIISSRSDGTVQYSSEDLVTERCYIFGIPYLVDSDGELMLVVHSTSPTVVKVFKVDVERRVLQPVKSIGSRAFFLGPRCLSVDADKLSSVDADCVYYSTMETHFKYTTSSSTGETQINFDVPPTGFPIFKYNLHEGADEKVSGLLMPDDVCYGVRPFSLLQLLATYCEVVPDVYAQLRRIHFTSILRIRRAIKPKVLYPFPME